MMPISLFKIFIRDWYYWAYQPWQQCRLITVTPTSESIFEICTHLFSALWASFVAQLVKNRPSLRKTWVWSLGWEDPLEKGRATHSSILAWRIPWNIQSTGSQRAGHDWVTFTFTFLWVVAMGNFYYLPNNKCCFFLFFFFFWPCTTACGILVP